MSVGPPVSSCLTRPAHAFSRACASQFAVEIPKIFQLKKRKEKYLIVSSDLLPTDEKDATRHACFGGSLSLPTRPSLSRSSFLPLTTLTPPLFAMQHHTTRPSQQQGAVENLDAFFSSMYMYYHRGGLLSIASSGVAHLLILAFTVCTRVGEKGEGGACLVVARCSRWAFERWPIASLDPACSQRWNRDTNGGGWGPHRF